MHLNSIRVERAEEIRGRRVLVLDDVMTTGDTLRSCRQLLLEAGARGVTCLALTKTRHI